MGEHCSECRKAENRFLHIFRSSIDRREKVIQDAREYAELNHQNKMKTARVELERIRTAHGEGRHA